MSDALESRRWWGSYLMVFAVGSIAMAGLAQQSIAQQNSSVFSETIDVNVVNVEVVVTDKDGQPITGLTKDDFELLEDGKPMQLSNFYEVEDLASMYLTEDAGEGGDDESPVPPGGTERLNLVVYVDNLNIRPENRKLLFENLRTELRDNAVPGSRVMVVTMNNRVEVAQPLTDDIDQIFASLDEIEKQTSVQALMDGERRMFLSQLARASIRNRSCNTVRPTSTAGGGGGGAPTDPLFDEAIRTAQSLGVQVRTLSEQRYQAARGTIGSLSAFSDTLGGLPGRKALLYLSDGVPIRPADSLTQAWTAKYDKWFQANENAIRNCSRYPEAVADLQRALTGSGANFDLHSDLKRMTERASDNRVAFYPISNSGRQASMVDASIGGGIDGGAGDAMRSAMIEENASRDASIMQMAEDTGGRVITGNANVGNLLQTVSRDFGSFYSLGYTAPEGNGKDIAFRDLEIKVKRDGVKVRHIKGYRAATWRDRLADMTVATALYEIEANPLAIQLQPGEPVQAGGRFKIPILVQIPFQNVQMVSLGEHYEASLSLLVVVRDKKGGFSKPRRFDLPVQIPNAQILQARQQAAGYPLELEVKKGSQRIAIGVRDHIGQTASSLMLDMDVGVSGEKKKKKKKKKKARG